MSDETTVKKTVKNNRGRTLPKPGPGRPKGSKNKLSTEIREAMTAAYQVMGGRDAYIEWLRAHRTEFYRFLLHSAPIEVELSGDLNVKLSFSDMKKSLQEYKDQCK